ncbi:MAG: hypothetical protein J2P54_15330 [Bradyrhizobiaceae bacterium]|nr:hypothetical protein [Bradyrhizobiaceae bacterium]
MSAKNSLIRDSRKKNSTPTGKPQAARRGAVPELQRQLLIAGNRQSDGRLRFAKGSVDTLATTYAALVSLQRKKLIAPEKAADPRMMIWTITAAGKAMISEKRGRR